MSKAEWAEYRRNYKAEHDRDEEPPTLGPSAAFSDQRATAEMRREWRYEVPEAETGRNSRAVTHRLRLATSGWQQPATAEEFYDAVQGTERTPRRRSILRAWLQEATLLEWWTGIFESAYSWQELAEALHRQGLGHYPQCARLNRRSRR